MSTARSLLDAIPPEHRALLLDQASREVPLVLGARLFEEGRRADRFWVIRSGQVEVDLHVPGRRAAVVETLGRDELLGWSWLFPPHVWHLGARVIQAGQAVEFDAAAVRSLCEADAALGRAVYRFVAETVAERLYGTRTRLLQLYGPAPGHQRSERTGGVVRRAPVGRRMLGGLHQPQPPGVPDRLPEDAVSLGQGADGLTLLHRDAHRQEPREPGSLPDRSQRLGRRRPPRRPRPRRSGAAPGADRALRPPARPRPAAGPPRPVPASRRRAVPGDRPGNAPSRRCASPQWPDPPSPCSPTVFPSWPA